MSAPGLDVLRAQVELAFGRKRGVANHVSALGSWLFGGLKQFEAVDLTRVERLVFVCTGNICRSAYAEQRAVQLGIPASSFGLRARSGDPADARARNVALRRGVEMAGHRARELLEVSLRPSDLVLAMEPVQAQILERIARPLGAQVSLLGLWSRPRRPHLEDPFGLSEGYFNTCMGLIDDAIERLAAQLSARSAAPC